MAADDRTAAFDISRRHTRRALLGSAAGAVGATVIAAVAGPQRVLAGNDDGRTMLVGTQYPNAQSLTSLTNFSNNTGVFAATSTGAGTAIGASSGSGSALLANTSSGMALNAVASAPEGTALRTSGRIRADLVSGVATIPVGARSVRLTPGVAVTADSFVLLTPRVNLEGRALWYTTNTTSDSITIRMSSSRTLPTKVAWLLLG